MATVSPRVKSAFFEIVSCTSASKSAKKQSRQTAEPSFGRCMTADDDGQRQHFIEAMNECVEYCTALEKLS